MSNSVDPPLFKSVLGTVPATDSVLLKVERPVSRLQRGRRQSTLSSAGRYRIREPLCPPRAGTASVKQLRSAHQTLSL